MRKQIKPPRRRDVIIKQIAKDFDLEVRNALLEEQIAEAATLLDRLASVLYPYDAADCRAMAKKLRGET